MPGITEDPKMNRLCRLALTLAFWPTLLLANAPSPANILRNATDEALAEPNAAPAVRQDPDKLNRLIETHILPHVDFVGLSRLTLGKHWGRTTRQQQAEFVRKFRTLLLRTYSASLTEYTERRVEYLSSTMSTDERRAGIRTRIVANGKPPIAINTASGK
jgi:phospholipid transport system substrate-binding protein